MSSVQTMKLIGERDARISQLDDKIKLLKDKYHNVSITISMFTFYVFVLTLFLLSITFLCLRQSSDLIFNVVINLRLNIFSVII